MNDPEDFETPTDVIPKETMEELVYSPKTETLFSRATTVRMKRLQKESAK